VPEDVTFATKPRLAVAMIERAIGAGVPFSWVAADSVYGVGGVEMALRRAGKGYVLGVASTTQCHSWDKPEPVSGPAEAIAAALPASRWVRLSAGAGTKGPRLYDWAYLELADLDARAFFDCRSASTMWTRGLLIRRGLSDAKMAFFSTWCPKGTPMAVLVEVEGRRWAIEDAFETAKTELGLAHNETRSWHGWHRHVSLVMLAFALLMVIRHKAETSPQKRPPTDQHKLWSDGPSRRSVVLPGV
jgi:SRSO17 transposase